MSLLRPISAVFGKAAAAIPTVRASSFLTAVDISPSSVFVTYRSKHSATQVKRLFKNNPARLRILKKKGVLAPVPRIPDRTYGPIFKPSVLKIGWSAPPGPDVQVPEYPFTVSRTGRKPFGAVGFLPVYRDVRIGGTKRTTIIRNVSGDVNTFISELEAVLHLSRGKKGILTSASTGKHGGGEAGRGVNKYNPIRIRTGGSIEVNGDRATEVRQWLSGLGF